MSKTNFTDQEAANIALEFTRRKVEEFAKSFKELRGRELKKALVPPHKHTTGTTSSSGVEDVPPGKLNPPGKQDVMKSGKPEETTPRGEETSSGGIIRRQQVVTTETMSKEELCKDCGKGHEINKCMSKAMLTDSKGKQVDNGIVDGSVLPGDKASKKVNTSGPSDPGSGGQIKKSVAEIRGKASRFIRPQDAGIHQLMHTPNAQNIGPAIVHGTRKYGPAAIHHSVPPTEIQKTAMPPMAKPPSGKNMGTHVPTSMNKEVKEMVVHGDKKPVQPPRGADFKTESKGDKTSYIRKNVGIFSRLGGAAKTAVTQALPALKSAAAGLTTVGGTPAAAGTKTEVPLGGQIAPPGAATKPARPASIPAPATAAGPLAGPASAALANAASKPPSASPVLTPRPALKPAGIGLATAGASKDNTMGDKTAMTTTLPGKPSNLPKV